MNSSKNDLTAHIQRIAERARQRQQERRPSESAKKVVRLPLWPAELRTSMSYS